MNKFMQWVSNIFKEAITKSLVTFLAGIFLTVLSIGYITGITNSLSKSIVVPVWPLFILSLFAIVGLLAASEKIWSFIANNRSKQAPKKFVDDRLEESTKILLRFLTRVEIGILDDQPQLRNFSAELLDSFDEWETSMHPYTKEKERNQIAELRKEIGKQFLPNGRENAKEWISFVKKMTSISRNR